MFSHNGNHVGNINVLRSFQALMTILQCCDSHLLSNRDDFLFFFNSGPQTGQISCWTCLVYLWLFIWQVILCFVMWRRPNQASKRQTEVQNGWSHVVCRSMRYSLKNGIDRRTGEHTKGFCLWPQQLPACRHKKVPFKALLSEWLKCHFPSENDVYLCICNDLPRHQYVLNLMTISRFPLICH